jgi:hypothetical protein
MPIRIKRHAINLIRLARAAQVAGLALHAGCDRDVAWRGVGTDAKDRDLQPRRDAPEGSNDDVPSP